MLKDDEKEEEALMETKSPTQNNTAVGIYIGTSPRGPAKILHRFILKKFYLPIAQVQIYMPKAQTGASDAKRAICASLVGTKAI
jgi:hypothetical protein